MEDLNYIKELFNEKMREVKDAYGFEYSFIIEVNSRGDHVDVNIGEFDDLNINRFFSVLKETKFKQDLYIYDINISIKLKQIRVEIKKGDNDTLIIWDPSRSSNEEYINKIDYDSTRKYIMSFSQSERVEAYGIYYTIVKIFKDAGLHLIKSQPKPESVSIKIFLNSTSVLDSEIISYLGTRFHKVILYTDDLPFIECIFERKNKEFT